MSDGLPIETMASSTTVNASMIGSSSCAPALPSTIAGRSNGSSSSASIFHCDVCWRLHRCKPADSMCCGVPLLSGPPEESEVFLRARRNFENYYGLSSGSATCKQIADTPIGIHGWADDNMVPKLQLLYSGKLHLAYGRSEEATPVNATDSNLLHFHKFFNIQLLVGEFKKVRTLIDAQLGTVYLKRWQRPGLPDKEIATKEMPTAKVRTATSGEPNERKTFFRLSHRPHIPEDAMTEIAVLQQLSQRRPCFYILGLVGCFEINSRVVLTTTMCSGGELFNFISVSSRLGERVACRLIWQLLQAVSYLHHHNIGHRDISLENTLLRDSVDAERATIQVMDFGQAVQLRADDARRTVLRYFLPKGKDAYRPPESYVIPHMFIMAPCPENSVGQIVNMPIMGCGSYDVLDAYGRTQTVPLQGYPAVMVRIPADAVACQQCKCEVVGYEVAPFDMFSVGVCSFIMLMKAPPWTWALPADRMFSYIQRVGMRTALQMAFKVSLSAEVVDFLTMLLEVNPQRRGTLLQALQALEHTVFRA